jgi:hypothetical protein
MIFKVNGRTLKYALAHASNLGSLEYEPQYAMNERPLDPDAIEPWFPVIERLLVPPVVAAVPI